jgi:NAD(P)-dependent dehydrogenase (short-subunit alcohol dehydrogenase family)
VAVSSLSKNLADELGPFGINVTCVHPGATFTERTLPAVEERAKRQNATPAELLKRMADNNSIKHLVTADEVAHLVTFLCSPLSIAINGDTIAAGGGVPRAIHY